MFCLCRRDGKTAERREYEKLRDALAKKQEEVKKLQEQCAALDTAPTPERRSEWPRDAADATHGHERRELDS